MTWPAPTTKLKGRPLLRELSNSFPFLSGADVSYNHPVYCTTAFWPAVIAAPAPGFSSPISKAFTTGAGEVADVATVGAVAAGGLPPQDASSARAMPTLK